MVSRHARRRLWLRGHCPWVGTPLPTSWRAHQAAAQEIEARAPEHLALEHLEAIDMPLHRARTAGECHARFDRLIVLAEPLGNASQGLQRTGGGACQPGIEAFGLPLAHEFRTVLGQVDGFGRFGLLAAPPRGGEAAPPAGAPARWPGVGSRAGTGIRPPWAAAAAPVVVRGPGPGPDVDGGHRPQRGHRSRHRHTVGGRETAASRCGSPHSSARGARLSRDSAGCGRGHSAVGAPYRWRSGDAAARCAD
jgi:hypothetical protein